MIRSKSATKRIAKITTEYMSSRGKELSRDFIYEATSALALRSGVSSIATLTLPCTMPVLECGLFNRLGARGIGCQCHCFENEESTYEILCRNLEQLWLPHVTPYFGNVLYDTRNDVITRHRLGLPPLTKLDDCQKQRHAFDMTWLDLTCVPKFNIVEAMDDIVAGNKDREQLMFVTVSVRRNKDMTYTPEEMDLAFMSAMARRRRNCTNICDIRYKGNSENNGTPMRMYGYQVSEILSE